jgi:Nucleotidyl transferase AbiEii toxin, Type IV TA system
LVAKRSSEWPILFDLAIGILDHFHKANGFAPNWSFGGGTALMLQIDHRESHDIDLFIEDPQILPFLNPETQGIQLERRPDSYDSDGTTVLKLSYLDLGEIDFICAPSIVTDPTSQSEVRGQMVALETAAEIIAKKVYFRGWNFQPRDMFDLAAVVERCGADYAIAAVQQCGPERCRIALDTIEKAKPDAVMKINAQLMVRDTTRDLIGAAQGISRDVLRCALNEQ